MSRDTCTWGYVWRPEVSAGLSFNPAPPYFLKQFLTEPGAQKFEKSR